MRGHDRPQTAMLTFKLNPRANPYDSSIRFQGRSLGMS